MDSLDWKRIDDGKNIQATIIFKKNVFLPKIGNQL